MILTASCFVQSMSGLNTEFEVFRLEQFEDVLINQAIIEFYVADLGEEDLELYPSPREFRRGL